MTATNISAPVNDIAQERNLVTAIPGPKSVAMQARRLSAVSGGVGAALPIYIERAAGGIVVDIDVAPGRIRIRIRPGDGGGGDGRVGIISTSCLLHNCTQRG